MENPTNIEPTIYSQEAKDIFLNYFIFEGKSCKVNLKNNDGDYYTFLLLSPSAFPNFGTISNNDNFAFIRVLIYVNKIMDIFAENVDHFLTSPNNKIIEMQENIAIVKNSMMKFLEDNPKYDKTKSMNTYNQAFADLDKFINYANLQTKVPTIEKTASRAKI